MHTSHYYNRAFGWLIAATAFVLFFRLGATPVYILDEAKNAQCAREMWHRADWIVPTFNNQLRTDKPVLHYWFMMLSYSCFGVHAWVARLFSVLMGLGTVVVTFYFVRKWKNAGAAFFAALALCLSTHFLFEFRLSVPDPYLIFFTTLGIFCGFSYFEQKRWKWLLMAATSLALATLAKGPVALALPGLSLLLYVLLKQKWKQLLDVRLLVAALLYMLIALPWYWAVHKATDGQWTRGFFFEHNLSRFSGEMEGHGGLFILTPLMVWVGLLPFSVLVVSAMHKRWRRKPLSLLSCSGITALAYIVFFSISSTKLPNYAMPCYPFVAVWLGNYLHGLQCENKPLPLYARWVLVILLTAIAVGAYFGIGAEADVAAYNWLAFPLLLLPLLLVFVFFVKRKQRNSWWPPMAIGYWLFNLYFLGVAYPLLYSQNPISKMMAATGGGEKPIAAYQTYNPAFNFNAVNDAFVMPVFQQADSLEQWCKAQAGGGEVLVITRLDRMNELDSSRWKEVFKKKDIFELPTTVLLRYQSPK